MQRSKMRWLVVGVLMSWLATVTQAADDLYRVLPDKVDGVAPQELMEKYLLKLCNEAFERRDANYEKLKTPEDCAAYQRRMKSFFLEQLGEFPERTPLNAKVVDSQTRDGYRIEKVIYESQPKHFVSAVLYLPLTRGPYPGVIVPCGHSANGKAADAYQRASILLAKNGIAALCYDPIGQGERLQVLPAEGGQPLSSTLEHTMVDVSSIPLGSCTARYRIWDGMRSLDYLASRPEIDPKRLGCTGNSGGGTLTSYLMALDERIVAAAPGCYLTNFKRLLETMGPQDGEQNIHAQIAAGMDHADYLMMHAPQPALMCVATQDAFDIGGSWVTFRQAKRFYTRMGNSERVDLIEADEKHGFTKPLRTGMVRWMRRWLLNVDDAVTEPDFQVMTDAEQQCTPDGQVMKLAGARSVFDLNSDWLAQVNQQRQTYQKSHDKAAILSEVRRLAGIRSLDKISAAIAEVAADGGANQSRVVKLQLRTEPGIVLPAVALLPVKPSGEAYLVVNGDGKQADLGDGALQKLVDQGHLVLAVDLRGSGETAAKHKMSAWDEHVGHDWKNYFMAYMLDKSYVGMRTEDILASARYLAGYEARKAASGVVPNRVHLIASGEAGVPALHAAALDPELFASVKLRQTLDSWQGVVRGPISHAQITNTVHGSLRVYDLPDLAAMLPPGKLTIENPLDAAGKPLAKK